MAGKERILAVKCQRSDRALDCIRINLDTAVVKEAGEAVSMVEPAGQDSPQALSWSEQAQIPQPLPTPIVYPSRHVRGDMLAVRRPRAAQ